MLSSSLPDVEIRLAQMSDLPDLLRLENACFSGDRISRRSFRRFLESAGASCLVAEANGQMLGYALLLFRSGTALARLYSFAVDPAARGSGLSRRLLAAAEADAFERERILLRLEVREDNAPARALYERAGYRRHGRVADYYEDGTAAIRMEKLLHDEAAPPSAVPYFSQTTDFTCGPACLMMALKHLGAVETLDERLELRLWRETTTIYLASGHGGCGPFGMAVAADENIDSVADVEGKRVAYPAANPSSSLKCDAMLAFAGLSRDDVEVVTFPTYAATMSSVAEDKADVTCTVTATGQMYELAESPRGIKWLDLDPDDAAGWERLNNIAPLFKPVSETQGAGLSKDNPAQLMAYRYPVLTVRADMDDDTAYALTKALDETYDIYKNATSTASRYAIKDAAVPPIDAPFHPGTIRYLKEIGVWSEDSAQWNEARLARLKALRAAWSDMMAENSDLPEDEFAELWSERREQALAELENR